MSPKELAAHYNAKVFDTKEAAEAAGFVLTETHSPRGEMWGTDGLDSVLARCSNDPQAIVDSILAAVDDFADGQPPEDDRTLVVAKVL